MTLDDRSAVLAALAVMAEAGRKAFAVASEADGKTGAVRDLLFGVNTTLDALADLIEESE